MKATIKKYLLQSPKTLIWLPYFLIFCIIFLVYYPTLNSEFIGDDTYRIYFLESYLKEGFVSAITTIMQDRPILMIITFLNYTFGGTNPFCYKLTSLLLHISLGFLVFSFFKHFHLYYLKKTSTLLPFLMTLFFLVHPVNTQTLMSSIQIGVILAAIGMIGPILFYSKFLLHEKRIYLLISVLFFCIGIFSKPNIMTLPLMIILLLQATGKYSLTKIKTVIPYVLLCLVPIAFYIFNKIDNQMDALNWYHYLLVQLRVIFFYFKLFIVPTNLHFNYDFDPNYQFYSWKMWIALAGHSAIFILTYLGSKRINHLWFAVACLYLAFIPESSIFPIRHVLFEHRTYVPYIFLCLILLIFFNHFKIGEKKLFLLSSLGVLVLFSCLTWSRIEAVNTYQKWAIDNQRYRVPSIKNDLDFLASLFSSSDFPGHNKEKAREIATKIVNSYPENQLINAYLDILSFESYSKVKQMATIEQVANILLKNTLPLTELTRNNFLTFIALKLPHFFKDQLSLFMKLEPIFQSQITYFKQNDFFYDHKKAHTSLLIYLKSYYEKISKNETFSNEKLAHYFAILEQLAYLLPENTNEIFKEIGYFEKKYPEHKKYFSFLKNKYLNK